ncbi:DUF2125 domain-containing protein [Devosia sp. SL43]|uniref:DUF2125 domain-containing protein n=1 Tax=Devosia sp. SL43 TaxID=2806348 RepID=UPI001F1C283B|nr:DUF2125 domain-containing protein [Devosia sp. SL43]UJW84034.1 DUF2125 domain-containing protein [Devosia sp. SL43]
MKKRIIILGSVVVVVIVLWSAAWLALSGVVKQNIDALALADGVSAPRITCGTLDIGGFPFRFDVECTTAQIATGDIAIDVPDIRASIRVYAPTHLLASATGPVQLTDTFTGSRNAVDWSALDASIRLDNWRIARASVSGKDVVWSDALMGEVIIAEAPLAEVHLFDIPEQHDADRHLAALSGYVRAEDIVYPAITLSDTNAEIQLELTGLPDDVRNWGDPNLLPAMAANGGTLNIVAIRGTDAASTLDASGALKLDPQGQIDGQITIASSGVAERIGPLLAEPWRTLVLGTPGADGAYSNQLNFRAGGIYSGLVPIATLPPLY